jgi:hypothetical protein
MWRIWKSCNRLLKPSTELVSKLSVVGHITRGINVDTDAMESCYRLAFLKVLNLTLSVDARHSFGYFSADVEWRSARLHNIIFTMKLFFFFSFFTSLLLFSIFDNTTYSNTLIHVFHLFTIWVSGLLPRGQSGPVVKLTTHLHLVLRLRICGVVPPLPHICLLGVVLNQVPDPNLPQPFQRNC